MSSKSKLKGSRFERTFLVTIRDSGNVYPSLESFRFEIETMVRSYGLPADVVEIKVIGHPVAHE